MGTKIRVLRAEGALIDCVAGKVYTAEDVVAGEQTLIWQGPRCIPVIPQEAGYTFRDEIGDSVGLQLSIKDRDFAAGHWEFAE